MTATDERINSIFERLVPQNGKADTVAGEIARAICRIGYRWYNDGDKLGVGYGKETCNAAGRYLLETIPDRAVQDTIIDAWGTYGDGAYESKLEKAKAEVLSYLIDHPELEKQENTEDMWDYMDEYEDKDDEDEDDEDDYYEEEETEDEEDW